MPTIRKLSESLIAKIAAGEVIERPFSVVKELVENSIDAGAKNIEIEVEEGGRRRITVIDDGCGMSREEALLALERHATSKLASEEDLFKIRTLGFRGEALPSIAAVSFLTLETITLPLTPSHQGRGDSLGVKIEVEGGIVKKTSSSPLPRGTRMTVENLFFNTPARLKFMKSKETEFSHIASWVESIALARPEVGFTLRHHSKNELRSPPQTEPRLRLRDILGAEVTEFLHPIAGSRGQLSFTGFASDHRATSTSTRSLFFFVNGRAVRDRTLQHAVLSAYENLLMKGKYPWVVLTLNVPPDFVDVNVHPTKNEVRFVNGNLVHELVREGIRESLKGRGEIVTPQPTDPSILSLALPPQGGEDLTQHLIPSTPSQQIFAPLLKIHGQVHGTYLICETEDKLILIDQHAAHERIGFEKLKKQYEEGGLSRQRLLIPLTFDLPPSRAEILKKYLADLAQVGLDVEPFGGHSFVVRTTPTLLEGSDMVSLIQEIAENLQSHETIEPFEEKIHDVLETMACHQQVRAGDRLTQEEIEALLQEMGKTPFAGQCPHGRPSVLEVPFDEIEKWFKRKI